MRTVLTRRAKCALLIGTFFVSTGIAATDLVCGDKADHVHRVTSGEKGPEGEHEWTFTSSNSASATALVKIPADARQYGHGILLYLHGDASSGNPFVEPWDYRGGFEVIQKFAEQLHMIPVSILAPYVPGDTRTGWWENAHIKGVVVEDVLKHLEKLYPIDLDRVVLTGVSGGATLLNGRFIPYHSSRYRGGAASLCGGYLNSIGEMRTNKKFLKGFKVRMVIGDQDFLLDYAERGARASDRILREAGFDSRLEIHTGGYTHCQFKLPFDQMVEKQIREVLSGPCPAREDKVASDLSSSQDQKL